MYPCSHVSLPPEIQSIVIIHHNIEQIIDGVVVPEALQ
jgi:hypothetical protein